MIAIIQRVSEASVSIENQVESRIQEGLLILLGIENADNQEDIDWLVKKISNLRIFNDKNETMNLSILDVKGEVLVVSQFTLQASVKKGNRPSYIRAAKPEISIPLYNAFIKSFSIAINQTVQTGIFGADMKVSLVNDGPVTILIDTKNKV